VSDQRSAGARDEAFEAELLDPDLALGDCDHALARIRKVSAV
jgi:hypothetical protein